MKRASKAEITIGRNPSTLRHGNGPQAAENIHTSSHKSLHKSLTKSLKKLCSYGVRTKILQTLKS